MINKDIKIVAIVGMSGSGKTVAVEHITSLGVPKIYFGGMVLREMEKRGIAITPENERLFREEIRRLEGKDWVVRQAIAEINDLVAAGQKRIVLDGVYSWIEYRILKHLFPGLLTFIAIVAPKSLRYERLAKRPRRPLSATAARDRDYNEIEQLDKGGPIAAADYYIVNDSTTDHLTSSLDQILREISF